MAHNTIPIKRLLMDEFLTIQSVLGGVDQGPRRPDVSLRSLP